MHNTHTFYFFFQFHGIHRPWNLLEVRAGCPGTPGFCLIPAVSHLLLHENHSKTWQLKWISDGFCGTASWEGLSWVAPIQISHELVARMPAGETVIWRPAAGFPQSQSFETRRKEESSVPFITSQNPLLGTPTFFFFNGIWSPCNSVSLFIFISFIYLFTLAKLGLHWGVQAF